MADDHIGQGSCCNVLQQRLTALKDGFPSKCCSFSLKISPKSITMNAEGHDQDKAITLKPSILGGFNSNLMTTNETNSRSPYPL